MEDSAGDWVTPPGPIPGPYGAYYPALYAFFLALTGSESDAARLSSRVVNRCWEEESGSAPPRRRKIELFRQARRAARMTMRSPVEPERVIIGGEDAGAEGLRACVRLLPALEREAVSLAFDAGLSCREIGDVLSLAEHEAALLLVRALKRLKGELEAAR